MLKEKVQKHIHFPHPLVILSTACFEDHEGKKSPKGITEAYWPIEIIKQSQEDKKGKTIYPSYWHYSQGNPSEVTFR